MSNNDLAVIILAAGKGTRLKSSLAKVLHPAGGHEPEFVEWRWEPMHNLPALVIPFKRAVYQRVVDAFADALFRQRSGTSPSGRPQVLAVVLFSLSGP